MLSLHERPERTCSQWDLVFELHDLSGKVAIDVGCGAADTTRQIAETWPTATVIGLEVDAAQHAKNVASAAPTNLRFAEAGAESMPIDDGSVDVAFLFKSLHHVPVESMDAALEEIWRVLKPGGAAHVVEPVFAGAFNDVLRLFHDEQHVRKRAFDALCRSVNSGQFHLEREIHHLAPLRFRDFDDFKAQVIDVTHTHHALSDALLAEVRAAFEAEATDAGAEFLQPLRVDVLRRPQ